MYGGRFVFGAIMEYINHHWQSPYMKGYRAACREVGQNLALWGTGGAYHATMPSENEIISIAEAHHIAANPSVPMTQEYFAGFRSGLSDALVDIRMMRIVP